MPIIGEAFGAVAHAVGFRAGLSTTGRLRAIRADRWKYSPSDAKVNEGRSDEWRRDACGPRKGARSRRRATPTSGSLSRECQGI